MTTLDELAATLPNGFHDARLTSLSVDYIRREARLRLDIWIGRPAIEAYRPGELVLRGLAYLAAEPPDPNYPFQEPGAEGVDIGPMSALSQTPMLDLPAAEGCFAAWIYMRNTNALVYVAARDASFTWRDEGP